METKNKTIAFRELEGVKRGTDIFNIDPRIIDMDYLRHLNKRSDYGDVQFEELKNSIRESGLKQMITVTRIKGTDIIALAHGYRRLTAILQIIEEDNKEMSIPAVLVPHNEEAIALSHITQNSQKALNPIELAVSLFDYKVMTGANINEVSLKTGIAYSKVHSYINFIEHASNKIKNAVQHGMLKMNVAMELVKQAKNTEDQNNKLERGVEEMQKDGRASLTPKDVKVTTPAQSKITLLRTKFDDFKESGKTTFSYDEVMELLNKLDKRKKQEEE